MAKKVKEEKPANMTPVSMDDIEKRISKQRAKMKKIDAILDRMQSEGKLPHQAVSILRQVGPSRLNCNELGKQKTVTSGNGERMMISSGAKKHVVRKNVFKDLLHTKIFAKIVVDRLKIDFPDRPVAYFDAVQDAISESFTDQIFAMSQEDIDDCYKCAYDAVKDLELGTLPLNKDKKKELTSYMSKKLEKMADNVETRAIDGDTANFGRLSTDRKIRTVRGGMYVSHCIAVTPFYNEQHTITAVDTYMERLKEIQADIPDKDVSSGAAYLDTQDVNSAIILEQYIRCSRSVIRNYMAYKDPDNEKDWELAVMISNENSALIFNAFCRYMPEGGQHYGSTNAEPFAVLVRYTNMMPYTVDSEFTNLITTKDDPVGEACRRLAKFSGKRTMDSPNYKQRSFWIEADELNIGVSAETSKLTITEMCELIKNGICI